jgi:hypothetical protein
MRAPLQVEFLSEPSSQIAACSDSSFEQGAKANRGIRLALTEATPPRIPDHGPSLRCVSRSLTTDTRRETFFFYRA